MNNKAKNNFYYKFLSFGRYTYLYVVAMISILALSSCKTHEKAVTKTTPIRAKKSKSFLLSKLKKNEFHYQWLSTKFSADVSIDSSETSFNVYLRAKKDSVIWMSISPALGIEVMRAIITKDSLKYIDRLHNRYFVGDYNYLDKLLNSEIDFNMLQSLLVGNSVAFYEQDDKLKSSVNDNKYVLSTIRKHKIKKMMVKNKTLKQPVQILWLDPTMYKITRILIRDFSTGRSFQAKYSDFEQVGDSLQFPFKANYTIKAKKQINISTKYSRVYVNRPEKFPFTIPEKYKAIEY